MLKRKQHGMIHPEFRSVILMFFLLCIKCQSREIKSITLDCWSKEYDVYHPHQLTGLPLWNNLEHYMVAEMCLDL